ncbi:adenine nucleotide alpha hydrolases-like protein [Caulochytrium protostelioides]|uniref:Diphthine--ammonia ligase n=1 Tax=Caulochytrium protostelioides TaxID=1555241 RepID=A0A4P9WX59_9FUNG|nr:adenine nucleotide alpha hydrolases-like protein [Caulochytrium protostelioides]
MAADQQQQQQPVPLKVLALLSGGKDSCFNLMHCAALGHEIVALANLHPPDGAGDELDSWMYQTVGHDVIPLYAEALGKPLYRAPVTGRAVQSGMTYHAADADADADADAPVRPSLTRAAVPESEPALGDEVEDLYRLIQTALAQHPSINAVSSGAIRSDYQRLRVENVCARLGLRSLGYLWMRDQAALLRAMIACDVDARLVKVAGMGLQPRHLGQSLAQMAPTLAALHTRYGTHVCGEGGEYETLTLDCPLFVRRIVLDATETVVTDADPMAPVAPRASRSRTSCLSCWRCRT